VNVTKREQSKDVRYSINCRENQLEKYHHSECKI